MSEDPAKPAPKLIDTLDAPEIFVDGVCGFFLHNGTLRLAFEVSRADHSSSPGPITRLVAARIAMPAAGARGLAVSLFDFLKKMGLEPGRVAPSVAVQKTSDQPPDPAPKPAATTTGEPPTPAPEFVEWPGAPVIFADGVAGFFLHNGILRIAFEASRFDHSAAQAPASRVLVARLAMPAVGASVLAVNLFDFLKKMGIDPASVSAVPTMQ
ncbi:MAG TPA: hypothetical protein VKQ29_04040 [Aliidongia sp.]|nr:hypothetical protein [Aliidongia sp.]